MKPCSLTHPREGRIRRAFSRLLRLAVLALPLGAFSCVHNDVWRHATLGEVPNLACIENAVRTVPAVDKVRVRHEFKKGSRALTWIGIKPVEKFHYYNYDAHSETNLILIAVDYRNEAYFHHSWRFQPPAGAEPQDDDALRRLAKRRADTLRPVMIEVEQAIARKCGISALAGPVQEVCTWVSCPADMPGNGSPE